MKVLILGATSSIARAIALELARRGDQLFLVARNRFELERICSDLRVRHQADVDRGRLDLEDSANHSRFIEAYIERLGGLDGAVLAVGMLGNQPLDSAVGERARHIIDVNFTSAVSLLAPVANHLESQGHGFIMGLSSVAGDRGRQSNYVYGAAKGGLSLYLQGLRNRLERTGVKVFTLKLGFVDTAMTYGMKGLFLVASPEQIARRAVGILDRPSGVYYLPGFWRPVMVAVRMIPERFFKRMSL